MRVLTRRNTRNGGGLLLLLAIALAGVLILGRDARAASATVTAAGTGSTARFTPNVANITLGDSVTFQWGSGTHTADVLDPGGSGDIFTTDLNATTTSGTWTPSAVGTYYFYCSIHAAAELATEAHVAADDAMVGKVVVSAAATATASASPSPTSSSTATTTSTSTATATPTTATATPTTATATPTTATASPTTATATPTTATATTTPSTCAAIPGATTLTLKGSEEVPALSSADASGTFSYRLDGTTLTYRLQVSGTAIVAAHLHQGAKGANGPIVVPLYGNTAGASSVDVCGTVAVANLAGPLAGNLSGFLTAFKSGDIYVNVHTAANPAGAIRAQVPAAPAAPATGTGVGSSSDTPLYLALIGMGVLVLSGTAGFAALRRRR